jgi:hypothetical protein
MKRTFVLLAAAALLAPAAGRAQSHNYGAIKQQIGIFESVLNTAMRQRYDQRFLMLQPPKGSYLEGYGVVFTAEVNLSTLRYLTPFTPGPYTDKELKDARAEKIARTKDIETLVKDLLRGNGAGLSFLKPEENVAVVVHLFNTIEHKDLPTQLIVQGKKQALDRVTAVLF